LLDARIGGAQPNISQRILNDIPFPLAPISEQARTVARIEELFAVAEQIEESVTAATKRVNMIEQSVLAKAFRGDLVPQDPNGEPASVLLERIEAKAKSDKRQLPITEFPS